MTMTTTSEKIQILLKALKVQELKDFLNTCPDSLTLFVMDELEKRMTEQEFISFANEF